MTAEEFAEKLENGKRQVSKPSNDKKEGGKGE